jgi:hypothetical protein
MATGRYHSESSLGSTWTFMVGVEELDVAGCSYAVVLAVNGVCSVWLRHSVA